MKKLIGTGLVIAALSGCNHEGIERGSRAAGYVGHAGIESVKGAGRYAVCGGREFAAALRGEHGARAQALVQDECARAQEHMNRASEDMNAARYNARRTNAPLPSTVVNPPANEKP